MISTIKDGLQILLQLLNLIVIIYGGYKFLNKPSDTLAEKHEALEKRVTTLELKSKEQEESLRNGNDRFRKQKRTNAAFKAINMAFINFEIAFCQATNYANTDELKKAKSKLETLLTEEDEDD